MYTARLRLRWFWWAGLPPTPQAPAAPSLYGMRAENFDLSRCRKPAVRYAAVQQGKSLFARIHSLSVGVPTAPCVGRARTAADAARDACEQGVGRARTRRGDQIRVLRRVIRVRRLRPGRHLAIVGRVQCCGAGRAARLSRSGRWRLVGRASDRCRGSAGAGAARQDRLHCRRWPVSGGRCRVFAGVPRRSLVACARAGRTPALTAFRPCTGAGYSPGRCRRAGAGESNVINVCIYAWLPCIDAWGVATSTVRGLWGFAGCFPIRSI